MEITVPAKYELTTYMAVTRGATGKVEFYKVVGEENVEITEAEYLEAHP